jgi:hypothetical protein
VTEPGPVTELEIERRCYLLALQRRATGNLVPRPPGVERLGHPAATLGDPIPGTVHWYTTDATRDVLYRAEWGEATLRLERLDGRQRRWIFAPGFLDRITGRKPDDDLDEIDEGEARRVERSLLRS